MTMSRVTKILLIFPRPHPIAQTLDIRANPFITTCFFVIPPVNRHWTSQSPRLAGTSYLTYCHAREGLLACLRGNRVEPVINRLSQVNQHPASDSTDRLSQGDKILKGSASIGREPGDENSPNARYAPYDFHLSHFTHEECQRPADEDIANREDCVSNRQRTQSVAKNQSFECSISAVASKV